MERNDSSAIVLAAPAIETLLSRDGGSFWPETVLADKTLAAECDLRNKLGTTLSTLFKRIPNPTTKCIDLDVCELLADFLDTDQDHKRLVLYLPFELIPAKTPQSERFLASYRRCWFELLNESDVRANFVDGNILEPELSPRGQPRVIKAAHLLPILLHKDILSLSEARALYENAPHETLKESLADALSSLAALNNPMPTRVADDLPSSLEKIGEAIACELKKISMRAAVDQSRGLPPARVAWEQEDKKEKLFHSYADTLARMVASASITIEEATEFLRAHAGDDFGSIVARWATVNILPQDRLRDFNVEPPVLNVTFSPTSRLAEEMRAFESSIELLRHDPEFSRFVYPVAVFFGSRLKGYAKRGADLDVAVLVRPGIAKKERQQVRAILAKVFADKRIRGNVVEFWLAEQGRGLRIRNFARPDVFLADSSWVHILLGGVWLGTEQALNELYARLLTGFLYSRSADARRSWLDNIEREVLLYRLLHKGYRRFASSLGGIPVEGTSRLDPQSTFWDSGYRRLATQLFVSRVFLPHLAQTHKKKGR